VPCEPPPPSRHAKRPNRAPLLHRLDACPEPRLVPTVRGPAAAAPAATAAAATGAIPLRGAGNLLPLVRLFEWLSFQQPAALGAA
jgi:hypothetical protein